MKKIKKMIFIRLLLFAFSFLTLSQAYAAPGEGFERKQDHLQNLIVNRLSSEVGLSSEQFAKVSEIMKKYHLKRRELRKTMKGLRGQLEMAANSENSKQASQLVSDIQKTRNEIEAVDDDMFKEIKPHLTPQQQAKYLLVMQDIRREIHQFKKKEFKG
ncbi:MAG: hypothetical protein JNK65_05790, partial [Deltaproteobacteria bacterium]|nr:hypothetical protein [Deltaproteobacteria bacterium]